MINLSNEVGYQVLKNKSNRIYPPVIPLSAECFPADSLPYPLHKREGERKHISGIKYPVSPHEVFRSTGS
jgi:hypothetical protein